MSLTVSALWTTGQAASGARFDDPFTITKGVYLIETALFTLHGDPTIALDVPARHTFDIPRDLRSDFQGRLLDLGIDAAHIHPDLDGLCKTLDWQLKSSRGLSSIT